MMMVGIVKWFRTAQGYGFITVGEHDYFVHATDLPPDVTLEEGMVVEFEPGPSLPGRRAAGRAYKVRVID